MMRRSRTKMLAGGLAAGLGLLACGGEEAPRSSGGAMGDGRPAGIPTAPPPSAANQAPVVDGLRIEPRDVMPGQDLRAIATASDPDGDPVRVSYTWLVNGRERARGFNAGFRPEGVARGDRVEVLAVATDGTLESAPRRSSARVGNRAPFVQGVTLQPGEDVRPGDEVTALVEARDADGDSLRLEYTWLVNGREQRERGRSFSTERLRRGDRLAVRVVARDDADPSRPETSAELEMANRPPVITGVPKAVERDGVFTYAFEARDPDGDRGLRYRVSEAPEGFVVDPVLGTATWRPAASQAGSHTIEVAVADASGDESSIRFEVQVTAVVEDGGGTPAKRAN